MPLAIAASGRHLLRLSIDPWICAQDEGWVIGRERGVELVCVRRYEVITHTDEMCATRRGGAAWAFTIAASRWVAGAERGARILAQDRMAAQVRMAARDMAALG